MKTWRFSVYKIFTNFTSQQNLQNLHARNEQESMRPTKKKLKIQMLQKPDRAQSISLTCSRIKIVYSLNQIKIYKLGSIITTQIRVRFSVQRHHRGPIYLQQINTNYDSSINISNNFNLI